MPTYYSVKGEQPACLAQAHSADRGSFPGRGPTVITVSRSSDRPVNMRSWWLTKPGNVKAHTGGPRGSPESPASATSGEERRVFPRVEMKLGAYLVGENGKSGKAELVNLSRGGVALSIDAENGLQVFPEGQIRPGKAVGLRFDLPQANATPVLVQVVGKVAWSQRVENGLFAIGIEFTAFQGDSGRRVEQYLLECMRID